MGLNVLLLDISLGLVVWVSPAFRFMPGMDSGGFLARFCYVGFSSCRLPYVGMLFIRNFFAAFIFS